MEKLNYYKSNYNVNFEEDFILSFDTENSLNDDFEFIIKLPQTEIRITNLPDLYTYSNGEDSELYISKVHDSENPIFLDDEYIIINDDILISYTNESANEIKGFFYKNGKTYIKVNSYHYDKDSNKIFRKLDKTSNNKPLKPICIIFKGLTMNSIEYFYKTILFNTNIKNSFRFVASNNAQQLSFFIKENEKYKKIKDFSFNYKNKKSEGLVYFAVNKNMKISNLNVSFLEA